MRLLLDTHAFLWWLAGDEAQSNAARGAKYRLGRLPGAAIVAADIVGALASQGFIELPLNIRDGQTAGGLPAIHKDLFDRMLIAQAIAADMVIVSNEDLFNACGVPRLW